MVIFIIIFSSVGYQSVNAEDDPYFTLVLKYRANSIDADYMNLVQQQLARIRIGTELLPVKTMISFELCIQPDWDIGYLTFAGTAVDPDFTGVYNENGSLNIFGYRTTMDYDEELGTGLNEWYMKQGNLMMPPDSEERVQHYWDWEQHLMNDLLLMKPVFSKNKYMEYWSGLEGYNVSDGLLQSWGKMSWSESHGGQSSINEIVIADGPWGHLNPIFYDSKASEFITDAIMDPLFWFDADGSVWPHLAESYTFLSDTHLRINCREGIKWQSDLDNNFTNEYFDAEDVYFTLYCLKTMADFDFYYNWIDDLKIVDQNTIDIYIDGDPHTPEKDPYAPCLAYLKVNMLPEHYLNQTQLVDGVTPDINHLSWYKYAYNCFGTGLFTISEFDEAVQTVLSVWDNCWRLNNSITDNPSLNWEQRFGDFSGGLDQLRVKIINHAQIIEEEFYDGKIDLRELEHPIIYRDDVFYPFTETQKGLQTSMSFFAYNSRDFKILGNETPALNDPTITKGLALRKAISYAINRVELNNIVNGGEYSIVDWPIYASLSIWCNPNIIRYNYDLDKAKEYMYKAGYEGIWTNTTSAGFNNLFHTAFMLLIPIAIAYFTKKRFNHR